MKISTKILIGFTFVLLLSVLNTATNFFLSQKVKENSEFLNSSQEIIRNSGQFQKSVLDMQSSFRGYLLSEDLKFLMGYYRGIKDVPHFVEELRSLVGNVPNQILILDSVVVLHGRWINYAQNIIDAKRKATDEPENGEYSRLFANTFKKQTGKQLNDQIAAYFEILNNIEYQAREMHSQNLRKSIKKAQLFSLLFIVLTLGIGVVTGVYVMRSISLRISSMVNLADSISKGNFTIVQDDNNDELSSLVLSMNVMSSNLEKSITQLEYRNTELDKFAYVVSHDLKAPLRGIYNVIKWIQEDLGHEVTPKLNEFLQIISNRTVRMEQLINGLLEYARLRTKAKVEITDVDSMVKELVSDIVPDHFQVELSNLPTLITECLKLQQVFSNLISNAVKFTPQENGHIAISAIQKTDHYEFTVKDNGIGIDPVYHERIFEIFQTLREKNDEESTGIGLSIVKKILDEHHETIYIESTPGEGASFIFTWHTNR